MQYVIVCEILDDDSNIIETKISPAAPLVLLQRIYQDCIDEELAIEAGQEISRLKGSHERLALRPATEAEIAYEAKAPDMIWVDDIVADFSDAKLRTAFKRAVKEFGDCVADYESDEFREEFGHQLKIMAAKVLTSQLVKQGVVQEIMDSDGTPHFELVET